MIAHEGRVPVTGFTVTPFWVLEKVRTYGRRTTVQEGLCRKDTESGVEVELITTVGTERTGPEPSRDEGRVGLQDGSGRGLPTVTGVVCWIVT